MLELAVGGAHNDTLVLAFLAGALLLTASASVSTRTGGPTGADADAGANAGVGTGTPERTGASQTPRYRAGALTLAAGVGIKVTAGIVLPFLVLAPRPAGGSARAWRSRPWPVSRSWRSSG